MAPLVHMLPLLALLPLAQSFSRAEDHQQHVVPEGGDWATRHMTSEHHISVFDSGSFFNLHDYSSRGHWDTDDILKTYGLKDRSSAHISEEERSKVIRTILDLYDGNHDGVVSREEFTAAFDTGKRLPDFNLGPGHHGDDEYEYEIHHFEKYHDENTKEEDLTHPEDIEHFKYHEEMERMEEQVEAMEKGDHGIVEGNIPGKFRKAS